MSGADGGAPMHVLSEGFIYFNVEYAGLIPEIPSDLDLTGRSDVLRIIDQAKKSGHVSFDGVDCIESSLGVNLYSFKLAAKGTEDLLLCAPVHMIAGICFVQEEEHNILGIKIGEVGQHKDISDLAVICCSSQMLAKSICNSFAQCFQLVFSEATMQCFDKRINEGIAKKISFMSTNGSCSTAAGTYGIRDPEFPMSACLLNRVQQTRFPSSSKTGSNVQSDSDRMSAVAADLIQDYMRLLHALLSPDELKQFAILLKRWRSENLPFAEFCQKVLELYGSERKHLLSRIRPFVPDKDLKYFVGFLEQVGIFDNVGSSLFSTSPDSDKPSCDDSSFYHAKQQICSNKEKNQLSPSILQETSKPPIASSKARRAKATQDIALTDVSPSIPDSAT